MQSKSCFPGSFLVSWSNYFLLCSHLLPLILAFHSSKACLCGLWQQTALIWTVSCLGEAGGEKRWSVSIPYTTLREGTASAGAAQSCPCSRVLYQHHSFLQPPGLRSNAGFCFSSALATITITHFNSPDSSKAAAAAVVITESPSHAYRSSLCIWDTPPSILQSPEKQWHGAL